MIRGERLARLRCLFASSMAAAATAGTHFTSSGAHGRGHSRPSALCTQRRGMLRPSVGSCPDDRRPVAQRSLTSVDQIDRSSGSRTRVRRPLVLERTVFSKGECVIGFRVGARRVPLETDAPDGHPFACPSPLHHHPSPSRGTHCSSCTELPQHRRRPPGIFPTYQPVSS